MTLGKSVVPEEDLAEVGADAKIVQRRAGVGPGPSDNATTRLLFIVVNAVGMVPLPKFGIWPGSIYDPSIMSRHTPQLLGKGALTSPARSGERRESTGESYDRKSRCKS